MKPTDLKKILNGDVPAPRVFLLWGEETFLRSFYKKKLIEAFGPDAMEDLNIFSFDGKGYSLPQVDEAMEALPVFAERKLLLFNDTMLFKPERTGAKADYKDYWAKRLLDIPDYVTVIFDESEIDKRSALLKQIDKEGACVEFAYMTEEEMVRWTVKLFGTLGKQIAPGDARYLNEITGAGMMAVKREAEKICAYAGERALVTKQDIDDMVVPEIEGKVFDMVAAILRRDASSALSLLEDLFTLKTDPNQILAAIIYNGDKLLQTKLLAESGADKSEIMSKLKIAPFAATKFMRDSAQYSLEDLRRFVCRLAETDGYLKGNSMDNEVLIHLLVSELSTTY